MIETVCKCKRATPRSVDRSTDATRGGTEGKLGSTASVTGIPRLQARMALEGSLQRNGHMICIVLVLSPLFVASIRARPATSSSDDESHHDHVNTDPPHCRPAMGMKCGLPHWTPAIHSAPSCFHTGGPHDIAGALYDKSSGTWHLQAGCWSEGGWQHMTSTDLVSVRLNFLMTQPCVSACCLLPSITHLSPSLFHSFSLSLCLSFRTIFLSLGATMTAATTTTLPPSSPLPLPLRCYCHHHHHHHNHNCHHHHHHYHRHYLTTGLTNN